MENNHDGRNKRKSERLDVAFTAIFQVEKPINLRFQMGWDTDVDALMTNISDLGMSIISRHDLAVGTELHIKFNIVDFHLTGEERWQHMEAEGTIVYNIPLSDVNHKIGIRFDRISAADKSLISNFVKRNRISSG